MKKYILEVEYDDDNLILSITVLQLMHDLVKLIPSEGTNVTLIVPDSEDVQ